MAVHYKISDLVNIGYAMDWVKSMIERGIKAGPVVVTMGRETRTTEQNSKQWPMLTDISKQVEWFGQMLTPEEWKDLATGSFRGCKILPSLESDGRFITVGLSTSRMNKKDFSAYIEYLYVFGAEKGVQWSEQSQETINENKQERA